MREAVLRIFYTDSNGKVHAEPQGKFFYDSGKPVFLADMTPNKWWRNYGGYSIAKQLLNAFSETKVKPQIIYRVKERVTLYYTSQTQFLKKGVLISYGGHEQYVLCIRYFKAVNGNISDEPKNLPIINLNDWVKDVSEKSTLAPKIEQLNFMQMALF